ncbi:hypothetical protein G6L37_00175 [Agrobacterium rubi]|nr:hypothetical protein [Agrobacterium rubi]NTF23666.1 hypothetical protein [Agrobacterium rubi]
MAHSAATEEAADRIMQAFYYLGQHLIGEEDGGVADMVEDELDFTGTVGVPVAALVAAAVGDEQLVDRLAAFGDADLVADIEPLCGPGESFSPDLADDAADVVASKLLAKINTIFPEVDAFSLQQHVEQASYISRSHLRSEANFRGEAISDLSRGA